MFRRGNFFWSHDGETGKQETLRTKDKATALRLLHSKNEAYQQPILNLQIARTYLTASDPEIGKRTWQTVMNEIVLTKKNATLVRWDRAIKDKAFDLLRDRPLLETRAEHFLDALRQGTVSTNVHLRKLHNFALDMNWLPWSVLAKRRWPKIEYGEKRGITEEEHRKIIATETNPERRAFYEVCWHVGAAQSDVAALTAEDVDWTNRIVGFFRKKTKTVSMVRFDDELAALLQALPQSGPLFPKFGTLREAHRATEFKRCCRRAGRRRSSSKTCAGNCCGATAGCEDGPEVNWADCSAPSWKPRARGRSRTSLNTSGPINRSSTPATSWASGLGAPCAAALSR
jgi:integrase